MENIRSLRDVRKQHKEQALAASKGSMAPQPSPPISECDFQSSASMLGNNDQSEDMKQDSKDEDNVIIQSGYEPNQRWTLLRNQKVAIRYRRPLLRR